MDLITLAELITLNDQNAVDMGVSDIFEDAPLLRALHAIEASNGTQHKYLKQTGAPTVGFRDVNEGRAHSKSVDELVTVNLKILDASFHIDTALADIYRWGPQAKIAREAMRHLRTGFKLAEMQIVNGTEEEEDGYTGLKDELDSLDHPMVIGKGGTTGALTSVWMFRTHSDERDVCVVAGQNANIEIGESFVQFVPDEEGNLFPAYMTPITGWLGLQIGGAQSIARLANIDDGSNKVDDDDLSELFELFPEEHPPNLIVMNKRSRRQIQQERTATNPTGAPAPWPMMWNDIPIISTSALTNAETQVTGD